MRDLSRDAVTAKRPSVVTTNRVIALQWPNCAESVSGALPFCAFRVAAPASITATARMAARVGRLICLARIGVPIPGYGLGNHAWCSPEKGFSAHVEPWPPRG